MNFKELVKDYTNESLKTLQQLIQIDSVYDVKTINESETQKGSGVDNINNMNMRKNEIFIFYTRYLII